MVGTLFIIEALKEGFIGILLTLDTIIYWLIAGAFKIFMAIAGARLLSASAYSEIANKIYIIVGVVMLFVLSYAILRGIIDPDKESKGEFSSKMLGRIVTAVIGLAIAPFLFNFMYQIQGKVLEDDIIGKLFFRIESNDTYDLSGTVNVGGTNVNYGSTSTNPDEYVKSIGGNITAVNLWQAFFFPSEDSGLTAAEIEADAGEYFASAAGYGALCIGGLAAGAAASSIPVVGWLVGPVLMIGTAVTACLSAVNDVNAGIQVSQQTDGKITLEEAYELAAGSGEFSIFTAFIKNYADEGEITYLFLVSTIAGAFALYAFVSFSIDMGIRAAMLAYLQIIAPIPLILQVLPKFKDNLHKYIGKVIGTFMEVFVRISVVYVVVYIICHLTELFGSVSTWQQENGLSSVQQVLALALLILGLIAFCRKAPEIISETLNLPKGNMNLGIGKKLADGGFYSGRSIAAGGIKSAVNAWNNAKPRNGAAAPTAGQRAGAALAGFGLGTARAVRSNFIGPDHKEAKTAKEATALSNKVAESAGTTLQNMYGHREAKDTYNKQAEEFQQMMRDAERDMAANPVGSAAYNAARDKYEKAYKKYQEAKAIARQNTLLGAAVTDLEERAKTWAVGNVDTTMMDRKAKFLAETRDLYDNKLKSTVSNEDDVKAANRAAAEAASQSLGQFIYEEYQRTHPGYHDTYDQFAATILNDPSIIDKEKYTKMRNERIKQLEDTAKTVTKRAVGRRMAEAASGIENDTSRAVTQYLNDHRAEFEAFKHEKIGEEMDATLGEKVAINVQDYMTGNFGISGLERGITDFANIATSSMINNSTLRVNYENADGATNVNLVVTKNATGTIEYKFVDTSSGHDVVLETIANDANVQENISRYVREHGYTKAKFKTTDKRQTSTYAFDDYFSKYITEVTDDETIVMNIQDAANTTVGSVNITRTADEVTIDCGGSGKLKVITDKNGDPTSYTFTDSTGHTYSDPNNAPTEFNTALQALFTSLGGHTTETVRKKAPSNMRMSKMKDTVEQEHDKFTFSAEYLDAQMRRRNQDAKKKNDQGK